MKFKSLCAIILIFACLTVTNTAFSVDLGVVGVAQGDTEFCWAASAKMILDYYGLVHNLSTIVNFGTGGVDTWNWLNNYVGPCDCDNDPPHDDHAVVRHGTAHMLFNDFGSITSNFTSHTPPNTADATQEINNSRPVIIRYGWKDDNGDLDGSGHHLVVDGYLNSNFYLHDPFFGDATVSFSDVNEDDSHQWTHTLAVYGYTVTPSAGAGGSISPSSHQHVATGHTTPFTINPNTGYQISSVSGCGGSLNGSTYTTGIITGNCTVTATFDLIPPSYTYLGYSDGSGSNNTVEFLGCNGGTVWHGMATCTGSWWVHPCSWTSYCSSGWDYDPSDYYNTYNYCYSCAPVYTYVGSSTSSGVHNTVEFIGCEYGQITHANATCYGTWSLNPCAWTSSCDTGWQSYSSHYHAGSCSSICP